MKRLQGSPGRAGRLESAGRRDRGLSIDKTYELVLKGYQDFIKPISTGRGNGQHCLSTDSTAKAKV
ncbi:hypothetical protein LP420_09605 [Massilia sp. B-10]|nr:hypothetical protein LP420_09605 [Massilia sp. B-10]